eukprot:comp23053_c0_seq1/m.36912 comp23053_c0_seq1/g.36912  ORF comp23053_c0_seq1/g.36912 comp23053_c0_seq1/m.36912 type:complete len:810 (-) comp23053_c0_seq1:795-3224(-)
MAEDRHPGAEAPIEGEEVEGSLNDHFGNVGTFNVEFFRNKTFFDNETVSGLFTAGIMKPITASYVRARVQCRTVGEDNHGVYWNECLYRESKSLARDFKFEPGEHKFEFSFTLPENLPATCTNLSGASCIRGKIIWSVKIKLYVPIVQNGEEVITSFSVSEKEFRKGALFKPEPALIPRAKISTAQTGILNFGGKEKKLLLQGSLSRNVYERGEHVEVTVAVKNETSMEVRSMSASIYQRSILGAPMIYTTERVRKVDESTTKNGCPIKKDQNYTHKFILMPRFIGEKDYRPVMVPPNLVAKGDDDQAAFDRLMQYRAELEGAETVAPLNLRGTSGVEALDIRGIDEEGEEEGNTRTHVGTHVDTHADTASTGMESFHEEEEEGEMGGEERAERGGKGDRVEERDVFRSGSKSAAWSGNGSVHGSPFAQRKGGSVRRRESNTFTPSATPLPAVSSNTRRTSMNPTPTSTGPLPSATKMPSRTRSCQDLPTLPNINPRTGEMVGSASSDEVVQFQTLAGSPITDRRRTSSTTARPYSANTPTGQGSTPPSAPGSASNTPRTRKLSTQMMREMLDLSLNGISNPGTSSSSSSQQQQQQGVNVNTSGTNTPTQHHQNLSAGSGGAGGVAGGLSGALCSSEQRSTTSVSSTGSDTAMTLNQSPSTVHSSPGRRMSALFSGTGLRKSSSATKTAQIPTVPDLVVLAPTLHFQDQEGVLVHSVAYYVEVKIKIKGGKNLSVTLPFALSDQPEDGCLQPLESAPGQETEEIQFDSAHFSATPMFEQPPSYNHLNKFSLMKQESIPGEAPPDYGDLY